MVGTRPLAECCCASGRGAVATTIARTSQQERAFIIELRESYQRSAVSRTTDYGMIASSSLRCSTSSSMKHTLIVSLVFAVAAGAQTSVAQHDHDQLGQVRFPTSCDAKVQAEFERGVAMLHSYWFSYAGKTFRGVLEQDPTCAMAYWGIALDLLGNTLSAPPSPHAARDAWELLEKARAARRENRARARLDRGHPRATTAITTSCPWTRACCAYNRAMRAARRALSGRLRGAGVLRADAAGLGAEERPDLRESVQVGRASSRSSTPRTRSIPASRTT